MIQRQVCDYDYEIVVVDNASDDDSVQVATAAGAKIVTLNRSAFSYGRALNAGIAACSGEIILAMSAHILLLNEHFLSGIPDYFNDATVVALRFTQAVSPAAVKDSLSKGPGRLSYIDQPGFSVRNWNRLMINHCAAFRRSCWELLPFDETLPDAEDKHWILQMMQRGYSMLYDVPGFYIYSKPVIREKKISATIRGYYGKWLVTGATDPLFDMPYLRSMFNKLLAELRSMKTQLAIHQQVYTGIRRVKRKKGKGNS